MKQDIFFTGFNYLWKKTLKKWFGRSGNWLPQKHSWVGHNGYWILSYSDPPIDYASGVSVRRLEGYTMEPENANFIRGDKYKDYVLPDVAVGSFQELIKNYTDWWLNFGHGFVQGEAKFVTIDGQHCTQLKSVPASIHPQRPYDSLGLVGSNGSADFTISFTFHTPSGTLNGDTPLFCYGYHKSGLNISVLANRTIKIEWWIYGAKTEFIVPDFVVSENWTTIMIRKEAGIINFYRSKDSAVDITHVTPPTYEFDLIYLGNNFRYDENITIDAQLSVDYSEISKYTLSNNGLTFTKNQSNNWDTARANFVIYPDTGKWYWETEVGNAIGYVFIGIGDTNTTRKELGVGMEGWSITQASRRFSKQTGGGTTWGSGSKTFTNGDVIGCLYDSDAGTLTWYKNGTLFGISHNANIPKIPVHPMWCNDTSGGIVNVRFKLSTMTNFPTGLVTQTFEGVPDYTAGAPLGTIQPDGLRFDIPIDPAEKRIYSNKLDSAFKDLYLAPISAGIEAIRRIFIKRDTQIVFKNKTTNEETIIPYEWIPSLKNDHITYTLPPNFTAGLYDNFLRFSDGFESHKFPVNVTENQKRTTSFFDDFSNPKTLEQNYWILARQWGGANGGVVAENVRIENNEVILTGNGDLYDGDIQGVDRHGNLKFHTDPQDPKFGQIWKNRVGACLVFKDRTGFGSYEVDALIPNQLGVCYAIWTFFYNEIYPSDPRWDDFIADGMHQQGNFADGWYLTRNHEIDIEFPSHLDGGQLYNPSLENMKCNTWRGESQNWDVPPTDPAYWEEYRDNLTPVGFNIADGNYHKLRFDWHADRVEFYIDGVLKQTNVNTPKGKTIPTIPGHFTFGLWFPSSPMQGKSWLVRPDRAWAGGEVDPADGGMKANFDQVEMKVKSFSFTPFQEVGEVMAGETYAFGGYRVKG